MSEEQMNAGPKPEQRAVQIDDVAALFQRQVAFERQQCLALAADMRVLRAEIEKAHLTIEVLREEIARLKDGADQPPAVAAARKGKV